VFFEECKFVIKSHDEYIDFNNHLYDTLRSSINNTGGVDRTKYPLYVIIDRARNVEWSYDNNGYNSHTNNEVPLDTFLNMRYSLSHHFKLRFNERFEDCSDTRIKKLVKDMIKRGKHLKSKNSVKKVIKYKNTSNYILYSRFEKTTKVYYLVVLTDDHILTTIYEFNIKDLKFFKES